MKLRQWLSDNSLTAPEFCQLLAGQMGKKYVSLNTVENWVQERSLPRRDALKAISAVTAGQVTANDFVA